MKVLPKKLEVSLTRVYQLIKERRKDCNNLVTENEAAFLIASENEVDITKYADEQLLTKLRGLKGQITINKNSGSKKQIINKITKINLDDNLTIDDPLLPNNIINEAKEMAKIYPYLYVFENSVRNIIKTKLEKYEKDWWNNKVSDKIKKIISGRKNKEAENPWHGKRGAHEIFYTDISDLKSIISSNWDALKDVFPSQAWINQRIEEIEMSRNIVAHNNPLNKDDINRIKVYFKDWNKQLTAKKQTLT